MFLDVVYICFVSNFLNGQRSVTLVVESLPEPLGQWFPVDFFLALLQSHWRAWESCSDNIDLDLASPLALYQWKRDLLPVNWGVSCSTRFSLFVFNHLISKGAGWGGSAIWKGCCLDASQVRFYRCVQPGGPAADPRHAGEVTSVFSLEELEEVAGKINKTSINSSN